MDTRESGENDVAGKSGNADDGQNDTTESGNEDHGQNGEVEVFFLVLGIDMDDLLSALRQAAPRMDEYVIDLLRCHPLPKGATVCSLRDDQKSSPYPAYYDNSYLSPEADLQATGLVVPSNHVAFAKPPYVLNVGEAAALIRAGAHESESCYRHRHIVECELPDSPDDAS